MASTSTKPFGLDVNTILEPVMRSGDYVGITPIAYFPDGQRMISGCREKTTQWDLQSGKEIEEARGVCEEIRAVAVSRDGRWVVTGGGNDTSGELKACEVETGSVKTFKGHSKRITCIDISMDSKLLASASIDCTARIWNLETGKLVAGPFKTVDFVGAVRLSTDSKKLAIKSDVGMCLDIWDIQKQKLDVRIGKSSGGLVTYAPVFWTNKNNNILAAFCFDTEDDPETIYEFNASTLETVGTPFKGHTDAVTGLALLFDGALLASASRDNTIMLWAFESRQLLASFDAPGIRFLIPSPDSLQLAFTDYGDPKIYLCNATSTLCAIPEIQSTLLITDATLQHLLESDATRRPTVVRRTPAKSPAISFPPRHQRSSPTSDHQRSIFLRHVRKLFNFTSCTTPVPPVQHGQPRDLWDFPATSPLPPNLSSSAQATNHFNDFETRSPPGRSNRVTQLLQQGLSFHRSESRHEPQVVEVAAGRKVKHLVAAKLPEYRKVDDTRHPSRQQTAVPQDDPSSDVDSLPDVHWFKAFFCYYSCWSHGRLRVPPRWRLERVDLPR